MINILAISIKNFLSCGNSTQAVTLNRSDLTLILGENHDLGGEDHGARNGVGKSLLLNAISYALYGQALTNIRKENLINKSNNKHMLVTIDFSVNGIEYRVERGRKPNILKFFVNQHEQDVTDESQGDSRETQIAIERALSMSHDMFRHVVALTTNSEPFLAMRVNDQRVIIEQLLGITLLSEKAEKLKEQTKVTRELSNQEEMRLRAVSEANSRIHQQIESLRKKQKLWNDKQLADCEQLSQAISQMNQIDIDKEIEKHKLWDTYREQMQNLRQLQTALSQVVASHKKNSAQLKRWAQEILQLRNNRCFTCGQPVSDQAEQIAEKQNSIDDMMGTLAEEALQSINLTKQIDELSELNPPDAVWYDDLADAIAHRSNLENLQKQLDNRTSEINPYTDQITEMTEQALQPVNYQTLNELKRVQEHEEFLLKLLTNKDSFIRKKIIEQNLAFLNSRLRYYLIKMGLPHTVVFQNDLSVIITELGRDMDFWNLSTGERTRLNLSLSWSFRDVWEALYWPINLLFIDEALDSGMDQAGVENAVAILKHMTRERRRSIWLISHREELSSRVNSVLKVVKEGGFTLFIQ